MQGADLYAIEANPQTFRRLTELCAESKSTNRLHPVHTAISSAAGQIDFFIPTAKSSRTAADQFPFVSKSSRHGRLGKGYGGMRTTLDEFCQSLAPDFIKMDIEGAEYRALLGAERILATRRPLSLLLFLEIHPWGKILTIGKCPEDVFKLSSTSTRLRFSPTGASLVVAAKTPGRGFRRWLKLQAITVIMRSQPLKVFLKKIVLWLDKRRQRTN